MDTNMEKPKTVWSSSQTSWTKKLLIASIVVSASASFSFGYGIAAFNTKPSKNEEMTSVTEKIRQGVPQTLFFIGNFIAAFTSGLWYKFKFINRKSIFLVNYGFIALSTVLALTDLAFSNQGGSAVFLISRLLHGYQGGMSCVIVPVYLNEISPRAIRGKVGFLHQLFITVGIFVAQFMGQPFLFGGSENRVWVVTYLFAAIPSIVALIMMKRLPMSPSELVQRFDDKKSAEYELRQLRNCQDVEGELEEIEAENRSKQSSKEVSIVEVIKNKTYRWPLMISAALLSVQALSGINAVIMYSNIIFEAIVGKSIAPYMTLSIGLVNMLVTIIGLFIVEKVGRRTLVLWCTSIMVLCHSALTILTTLLSKSKVVHGFTLLYILLFISSFALSLGPIPFIYATEVTRQENRTSTINVGLVLNYFINIIMSLTFPLLYSGLSGVVFLCFAAILAMGNAYFYFKMVETKNKTTEEIEGLYKNQSSLIEMIKYQKK